MRPVIALLTDFGLSDNFVGVMKGVIARHCPEANVIDITHRVPAYSVMHAALALLGSYRFFPKGTVFAAVVDPGVGTARKALAMRAGGYTFVAPDNGLLSPVARENKGAKFYEITYRPEGALSDTFHGRDVFAPVAAMLAAGKPMKSVARAIPRIAEGGIPAARVKKNRIEGQIIYIDAFGNAMSNIRRADVAERAARIRVGGVRIKGVSKSYAAAREGKPLAIFNSFDMLEVAVNRGDAAHALGLKAGEKIVVEY